MQHNKIYTITPKSKLSLGLKELFEYRELIYIFTWREIKVKYKQTFLGVLWVALQPIIMMLIINIFLSRYFKQDFEHIPYYLYVYSGLIAWNLFASGANTSVNNILMNANIIKKIYFPRMIIPLSSILSSFVDYCISLFVLILFMIVEDVSLILNFNPIYWILATMIIMLFSFSLGLYFSALVVKYRDFRYILPFLIQLLFFLSPVMYKIQIEQKLSQDAFIYFNPMVLGIELIRTAVFNVPFSLSLQQTLITLIILSVYCLIAVFIFKNTEEYIADKI